MSHLKLVLLGGSILANNDKKSTLNPLNLHHQVHQTHHRAWWWCQNLHRFRCQRCSPQLALLGHFISNLLAEGLCVLHTAPLPINLTGCLNVSFSNYSEGRDNKLLLSLYQLLAQHYLLRLCFCMLGCLLVLALKFTGVGCHIARLSSLIP